MTKKLGLWVGLCTFVSILVISGLYSTRNDNLVPAKMAEENNRLKYTMGCINSGSPWSFCDCSYSYFYDSLGPTGMNEMADKYLKDKVFTETMIRAVARCTN